jgi:hypothetical protein
MRSSGFSIPITIREPLQVSIFSSETVKDFVLVYIQDCNFKFLPESDRYDLLLFPTETERKRTIRVLAARTRDERQRRTG